MKHITYLLVIIPLVLFSCFNKNQEDPELTTYIQEKLQKDTTILSLVDYKPALWNKLYLIGPYTNENALDATLRKYKGDILRTNIDTDDGFFLMALFQNDEMVSLTKFQYRIRLDQSALRWKNKKCTYWTRSESVFPLQSVNNRLYLHHP
jgi:hypothetical protein